jgi:hypothetical protein
VNKDSYLLLKEKAPFLGGALFRKENYKEKRKDVLKS